MSTDEQQIRQLVATWMAASRAGDVEATLSLMTDDVVFLLPGRPPMRKDEFAALSLPSAGGAPPKMDGSSEIQEVQVSGDWAFLWSKLSVVVTPPGGSPMERAGHTLTIFQRVNGKWLLTRDANLLTPVPKPAG